MVAFTAVSCSDNDDSENSSPEEEYDYEKIKKVVEHNLLKKGGIQETDIDD